MTSLVPHSTLDQPNFDVYSRVSVFEDTAVKGGDIVQLFTKLVVKLKSGPDIQITIEESCPSAVSKPYAWARE